MPHIVLEGPVDLPQFFSTHTSSAEEHPGKILKLQNSYISRDKNSVLIEALAVEGGPPNRFLVQVVRKGEKTTVKIYPGSDPEKTDGLKKILAIVAHRLKKGNPDSRYGSTNLQDYLL